MNLAQIEALWVLNGGDPRWAPLAAGIAIAESGGDTRALNANPDTKDFSVGLWQINYYGPLYASRSARYGTPDQLSGDVNRQARAAISLFGPNASGASSAWGGGGNLNNADPVYQAWAAAGYPRHPSTAQVTKWLRQMGRGTGFAQGPTYSNGVFSGPTSSVQITGTSPAAVAARKGQLPNQQPLGVEGADVGGLAARGAAGYGAVGCNAQGTALSYGGVPVVHWGSFTLTACNRKALVSGLLLGTGVVIMGVGVVLLGTAALQKSKLGSAVLQAIPATRAASAVSGAANAATTPAAPKQPRPMTLQEEIAAGLVANEDYADLPRPPKGAARRRGRVAPPDAPPPNRFGER